MRAVLTAVTLILVLVFGVFIRGRDSQAQTPPPSGPPPAPVEIATATTSELEAIVWVPGTVVSREDARIASEQAGRLTYMAEVGENVARGAVIARVDDEALRLTERDNVAALARAESQLEFSRRQLERLAQLKARSLIPETQHDEARSLRDVRAQDLAQARVALAETRRRVRESTIRAPFDGVVAERTAQVGEFISAGMTVARLVNTRHLEVTARAPVAMAASLRPGATVTLRNGKQLERESVRAVVPVGDVTSRQLELRIELADGAWPIGAAVEVSLAGAPDASAVTVPRDALILRGQENFVLRVGASNKAERIEVETGTSNGDLIEVRGAIVAGDRVIVRGGERLTPGQVVAIKKQS